MTNYYQLTLSDEERQLLNDLLAVASAFVAAITGEPMDDKDMEIVHRVLIKTKAVSDLSIKLNLDKFKK